MRDPDVDRMCCAVPGAWPKWFCEVDRFMADAGIGIAETLLLIAPSVCKPDQYFASCDQVQCAFPTSRGRRTENMPPSWDMTGAKWVT